MNTNRTIEGLLAQIPSVDSLLALPEVEELISRYSRTTVVEAIRIEQESLRQSFLKGDEVEEQKNEKWAERIVHSVTRRLEAEFQPSLRRVINATGIILHTGLGRAPLIQEARDNLMAVTENYCSLEIDLASGKRGDRVSHVERLLCRLSGAEAACVVNNNAGAVLLVLNTLAYGREAIVSRGQLIEIGGSFRMPEVMEKSGAKMVEVGTTNRTHLRDYQQAINENTALILTVHTSNYRLLGFTAEVKLEELVELGRAHGIPVVHDLGGGVLVDLRKYGLPHEPLVQENIQAGADVVSFSGDKILGGPQSGIIVGKKLWLDRIKKNPLMRALRCGKLTYAALEPTLKLFFREKELLSHHRVLRMLTEPIESVEQRVNKLMTSLNKSNFEIEIENTISQTGGGALPLEEIPSIAVTIRSKKLTTETIASRLRSYEPPILGYVRNEKFYLDMRTVGEDEVEVVVKAVNSL